MNSRSGSFFKKPRSQEYLDKQELKIKKTGIRLFFDGACDIYSGGDTSSWGCVVFKDDEVLFEDFAFNVFAIISGYSNTISNFIRHYYGSDNCHVCDGNILYETNELDHIYPVKFGGGGGWLSNYKYKCKKCHREKTNTDFGFKQAKVISMKDYRDKKIIQLVLNTTHSF